MNVGVDFQGIANVARFLRGRLLLGRLAVLNGYVREDELRACLREQHFRPGRVPLASIMVECGMLTDAQVEELLRQQKYLEDLDAAGRVVPAMPGVDRMVGRYAILEEVGSGAAGVVWKAWDTQLQRCVALKELRREVDLTWDRILGEVRAAARLRHPNLVEVYEAFQDGGRGYIVMSYVDGVPFDRRALPIRRVVEIMAEVCDAVHYMHRQGILHRDIRPQSILVDAGGRGHLGDFCPAEYLSRLAPTAEGRSLGAPLYMAPEQVSGNPGLISPATDVYGLGATLYQAVTGRPPFEACADLESLFWKLITDSPVPPSRLNQDVTPELEAIILHAMEKVPSDRYANAAQMGDDLRRLMRDEAAVGRPAGTACRGGRVGWMNGALAAAVVVAAVGLSSAVLLAMGGGSAGSRSALFLGAYQKGIESWSRVLWVARGVRVQGGALEAPAGEAARWFEAAAVADPSSPAPWLMRGRCLILLGRGSEAERAFGEALERDPLFGPALLERGKYFGDAYLRKKLPPSLMLSGGRARLGQGEPEDEDARCLSAVSREYLERARAAKGLDPVEVRYLEGAVAFWKGRYGEVVEALDGYVRANAWDAAAVTLLAEARAVLGGLSRAEELLGCALDIEPAAHRFRARGDVRFCMGRPGGAADDYTRAIRLDPGNPALLCNRGLARQALGDFEGALADFDRAIEARPDFARAYNYRGAARAERLDLDGALADFKKAVELRPFYAEAYNNLGNVLLWQQKVDEAIDEYGMALGIDPDYAEAYANRGAARRMKGDAAGAAADFREALRCDPGNADILFDLALALESAGDREQALLSLKRAAASALPGWPRRTAAERLIRFWSPP